MSRPEQWDSNIPIMEESERLKNLLLPRHIVAEERAEMCEDAAMGSQAELRALAGYAPAEEVDLSEIVDMRAMKFPMLSPKDVNGVLPLTQASANTTRDGRRKLESILDKRDLDVMVGLGECGVHHPETTLENARLIKELQAKFPHLFLVLRVFLEKPRTPPKGGEPEAWKGFLYDPDLNGANDINKGVIASRMLLCRITDYGVSTMTEQLNPLTAQFMDGAVTQKNTGARNAQDQTTMELMAADSAVTGNKHTTNGLILSAAQASASSARPHSFIGVNHRGRMHIIASDGNPTAHIILRGGSQGRNYYPEDIASAIAHAEEYGVVPSVSVDLSHDNSLASDGTHKEAKIQLEGAEVVAEHIESGNRSVVSVQMETGIVAGKQPFKLGCNVAMLDPKKSITDELLGPEDTEATLSRLNEAAAKRKEAVSIKGQRARMS